MTNDPEVVAFPLDVEIFGNTESWTLAARAGPLDVVFKRDARPGRIGGIVAPVASLLDGEREERGR